MGYCFLDYQDTFNATVPDDTRQALCRIMNPNIVNHQCFDDIDPAFALFDIYFETNTSIIPRFIDGGIDDVRVSELQA